jgi:hypothetical protein
MERKYKISFKGIFEPTPVLFKRIGLALVAAASFGAGLSFVSNDKVLGITVFVLGAVGKFVTAFFSESLTEVKVEEDVKVALPVIEVKQLAVEKPIKKRTPRKPKTPKA